MLRRLDTAYLSTLNEQEKSEAWSSLAREALTANGQATAYLQNRIRRFEIRYEMSSEELLQALRDDRVKETAEIAEWLFLLSATQTHGSEARL